MADNISGLTAPMAGAAARYASAAKLPPFFSQLRLLHTSPLDLPLVPLSEPILSGSLFKPAATKVRARCAAAARSGSVATVEELRERWLSSMSCPFPERNGPSIARDDELDTDSGWVIGVDPDASGALAVLKSDGIAEVFDTPHLQVLVGKRMRKRLDAKSIVHLLSSCGAPLGTTAYIEQSVPFPKDGKQGWWSGGYTYGLWIGILVASGFSVIPVSSRLWKDHFELCGSSSSKDDSRKTASLLFPLLSSQLKRKKDHGRAEALLIAAYGKGLKPH